jgi:deoxyribodipyrimidine photo-lyase
MESRKQNKRKRSQSKEIEEVK